MANPYKNTNRAGTSPFKQTDRLTQIQDMKDRLNKKIPYNSTTALADPGDTSMELKYFTSDVQPQVYGSAGALEWISPAGALKIGKGIWDVGKKLWNMGRKGGYGYSKPIATGKPFSHTGKVTYKNWGGKQHEFKELQNLRVTKQDIKRAEKLTKPYKIAGTVGRTGVTGAAITGAWNFGDVTNSEVKQAVVKQDNTFYDSKKIHHKTIDNLNRKADSLYRAENE